MYFLLKLLILDVAKLYPHGQVSYIFFFFFFFFFQLKKLHEINTLKLLLRTNNAERLDSEVYQALSI